MGEKEVVVHKHMKRKINFQILTSKLGMPINPEDPLTLFEMQEKLGKVLIIINNCIIILSFYYLSILIIIHHLLSISFHLNPIIGILWECIQGKEHQHKWDSGNQNDSIRWWRDNQRCEERDCHPRRVWWPPCRQILWFLLSWWDSLGINNIIIAISLFLLSLFFSS